MLIKLYWIYLLQCVYLVCFCRTGWWWEWQRTVQSSTAPSRNRSYLTTGAVTSAKVGPSNIMLLAIGSALIPSPLAVSHWLSHHLLLPNIYWVWIIPHRCLPLVPPLIPFVFHWTIPVINFLWAGVVVASHLANIWWNCRVRNSNYRFINISLS
jgi:hypothetical protein